MRKLLGTKIDKKGILIHMSNHCVKLAKKKRIIKSGIYHELWAKAINYECVYYLSFSYLPVAWVFHSRKLIIVVTHLKKESCRLFAENKKQLSRGFITLLKKRLWHRCFHENFVKFSRKPFLQNTPSGCFWRL